MSLLVPITLPQVDAESPIDEQLMDAVRVDLDDLDTRIALNAGASVTFRVNGLLDKLRLTTAPQNGKGLDGAFITKERALSRINIFCGLQGAGGNLKVDVRRIKQLDRPIESIKDIFTGNIQSIARASGDLLTQSIVRAEGSQFTQSVNYYKPQENIKNIVAEGGFQRWRINLTGNNPLDNEYSIGDYINVTGAVDPNNNGTFQIVKINQDNGKNIVIDNPLGIEQISITGNMQLNAASFNFNNAIPANFVIGEKSNFIGHVDAASNGVFTIFKVNELGNNIIVKLGLVPLVEQAGVGGSVECLRFKFTYLLPVVSAFALNEVVIFSGHTDINNNGNFEILAVNELGDNVIIYNELGVVQGAVAGQITTNRFVYALDVTPLGFFVNGDKAIISGATDINDNGNFSIVDIRYLNTDNIVIYNSLGVTQAGPLGIVNHSNKAITFTNDYSLDVDILKSSIEITGAIDPLNNSTFLVIDTNRAAISPFNFIVDMPTGVPQLLDRGRINKEIRSIFNSPIISTLTNDNQVFTYTSLDGNINTSQLKAGTILLMDILEAPIGATDISVNLN